MQFLQLQQQAGSISTKNSLSCQNPESPTPGQFFQQKHLKEQTQTVEMTVIATSMKSF